VQIALLSLPTAAPHLICFTEHHLKDFELANTHIPNYTLGSNYCGKNRKQGGVCIYVHESLKFSNINLLKYSKEQDIEIAATQLNIHRRKVIIIARSHCARCYCTQLQAVSSHYPEALWYCLWNVFCWQ
jgi:hypothetical protein